LFFQIVSIELLDKRGYLTICLSLSKEGRILLRKPEGIKEWFQAIKVKPNGFYIQIETFVPGHPGIG
jgi:hypothetical protein